MTNHVPRKLILDVTKDLFQGALSTLERGTTLVDMFSIQAIYGLSDREAALLFQALIDNKIITENNYGDGDYVVWIDYKLTDSELNKAKCEALRAVAIESLRKTENAVHRWASHIDVGDTRTEIFEVAEAVRLAQLIR